MLDSENRQNVQYFTGSEVEHTPMFGQDTLFVVGIQPIDDIVKKAYNIQHVYLGTSQSFNPSSITDWKQWDRMILGLLELDYWVTLDFDVNYAKFLYKFSWNYFDKFIPMISVKLPNISLLNNNATIKLDDITWGHSNTGVWTHKLESLKTDTAFTDWDQYINDTIT
jgi:hypothetical protein